MPLTCRVQHELEVQEERQQRRAERPRGLNQEGFDGSQIFEGCQSAAETLVDKLGEEAVEQLDPAGVEAVVNTRCSSSILCTISGWETHVQVSKIVSVVDHHKQSLQHQAEKAEQAS